MSSMGDRAGEQLRSFQDRALSHQQPQDISALVEGAKQARGVRIRRRNTILGGAAAALVALSIGVFYPNAEVEQLAEAPSPAPFEVQGAKTAPSLGALIEAGDKARAMKFEGGEMTLAAGSRGKVLSLHDLGADVQLLDGEVHCDIVPGRGGKWSVVAGDYRVTVVGTVFDIRYSEKARTFEVDVTRGIVDVSGPGITGVERLEKGESLRFPKDETQSGKVEPTGARQPVAKKPSSQGKNAPTQKGNWKTLAEQGKYGEAMEQVEKSGFASTAGGLSVADLVRLADVARMAGRSDRATDLLHRIRKTAPGSHHAATAAYSLGTTAFDQRGDHAGAARWFSRYLREAPGGPLSREALGRMMEAQYRAGMTTAATDSARKYLGAYPTGPHRGLAQKLTAQ